MVFRHVDAGRKACKAISTTLIGCLLLSAGCSGRKDVVFVFDGGGSRSSIERALFVDGSRGSQISQDNFAASNDGLLNSLTIQLSPSIRFKMSRAFGFEYSGNPRNISFTGGLDDDDPLGTFQFTVKEMQNQNVVFDEIDNDSAKVTFVIGSCEWEFIVAYEDRYGGTASFYSAREAVC